ncbi:MAG: ABC transporter permease [Flavobacteriaceae bacterium]
MSKLRLIIKREYLARIRNRSFIVMTFMSPLLFVLMLTLILWLVQFNTASAEGKVWVLDESTYFEDVLSAKEVQSVKLINQITLSEALAQVAEKEVMGLLYIPKASSVELSAEGAIMYSKNSFSIQMITPFESAIRSKLEEERLRKMGINQAQFDEVTRGYSLKNQNYQGELNLKGINEIKAFIGGAFGYLLMMFIIIYGGLVMRSVIEEKSSRIIEVIVSSVKPIELMIGKIVGTTLAGLTQFMIWICIAFVLFVALFIGLGLGLEGLFQREQLTLGNDSEAFLQISQQLEGYIQAVLQFPWESMAFFFMLFFILGYLIYSSLYAAIGAAVDQETDTQQFMFPIVLPLVFAMYIGFISVFDAPHGDIAVFFSIFPLTAPIVMLMRLPFGIGVNLVEVWQLILSLVLSFTTFLGILWLSAKIYSVGILMHGQKPSLKKIFRWIKS